ncbi:hypothetical protein TWF718_011044 [Orbilia javanica]|uniref:Uncharacterized protein n=1 Tax=Orbilia javanica TaxID=47235 RepID=A0AAN8MR70_9PEZI
MSAETQAKVLNKDIPGYESTSGDHDHTSDVGSLNNIDAEKLKLLHDEHNHLRSRFSQLISIPACGEDIEAAGKLDYVHWKLRQAEEPPKRNKDGLGFEFPEHSYLGDSLKLAWDDGKSYIAKNKPITLPNGLKLTYGEINALAGDFYGTVNPISNGKDLKDQQGRFRSAWHWLAEDTTRNPNEAEKILNILSVEAKRVQEAVDKGQDPSEVYPTLKDTNAALQLATITRPAECPSYLVLASINWDHFGIDARTAYNACHSVALETAANGDLQTGYAMNAFGDHFLQDSFAAGHMRTPRRILHNSTNAADLCAKFMHDEDNAIGLDVESPAGKSWRAYGDKRLLDKVDADNKNEAWNAVRTSADEIYQAYKTKKVTEYPNYGAWEYAPTLESAQQNQLIAPLFRPDGQRRADIRKRCEYKYTNSYWYLTTALDCEASGLWTYPIEPTDDCKI